MPDLPGCPVIRHLATASIVLALALGACADDRPLVHTGALPAEPPPVAPRVFEGVPIEAQPPVAGPQPRELAFGITEDELPLRLTIEDLQLGAAASGMLLAAVSAALVFGWLLRLLVGTRGRPALAAAQEAQAAAGSPPGGTTVVLHMQQVQQAQQLQRLQRAAAPLARAHAGALEGALAAPPPPAGPSTARRAVRRAATAARGTGRALGGGGRVSAGGARRLARWTALGARVAWRLLAIAPRQAWNEFERQRSPYRDGGDFWMHGTEMLRMGVQNEAERHYWSGFYECENKRWDIEGAECLRRLAHLAAQRGDNDEALRHFEAARALLEGKNSQARLAQVRGEIAELQAASGRQSPSPAQD